MEAHEIALEIAKSPLTLEQKLSWHFANFETPIPESLIPVAVRAVEIANAGGDSETLLDLPDGIKFVGASQAPVKQIIEAHYLWHFLDDPAPYN